MTDNTKDIKDTIKGSKQLNPENILEDLGGCGRYQTRMVVIIHLMKTAINFSVVSMVVVSRTPPWWCDDVTINGTTAFNDSEQMSMSCVNKNNSACQSFSFSGSPTIVSEFNLVCDQNYLPAMIMSSQTFGMMVGNPMAGQLADLFGRKVPLFSGILIIGIGSLVSYFSFSWHMFLACRVVVGIGSGFFMTVQYNLMSEFILEKWRPWIVGFPSWQMQTALFALIGWLLDDWQYIQLVSVATCVLGLLAWWTVFESFRWYLAHDRYDDAKQVLESVGKVNQRELTVSFPQMQTVHEKPDRKYTFRDMFRTKYLVKISLLSTLNWFTIGMVSYGLGFNIQALSGNVYFNMFLFSLTSAPVKAVVMILLNRIGRRRSALLCFLVSGTGSLAAIIIRYIDTPHKDTLTNVSAMIANIGIEGAWSCVQTMTVEMYPTVIRTTGFGTMSTIARASGAIAPQLVFLDSLVPGVIFIIISGLCLLSLIGTYFLPETHEANLQDKIKEKSQSSGVTINTAI